MFFKKCDMGRPVLFFSLVLTYGFLTDTSLSLYQKLLIL